MSREHDDVNRKAERLARYDTKTNRRWLSEAQARLANAEAQARDVFSAVVSGRGGPMTRAAKPATALPDLISQLEAVNELLESNEEGELSYVGRRDLQEKRNRLAEQIAELESGKARKAKGNPSQLEAARRARGNARFSWRTDAERVDRLKSMASDDGTDASDFLDMLVDGEWRHREERGRKRKRSA